MENLNFLIGNKLKEERVKLGYSQESFADLIGIHRTYIGTIERGEKSITVNTLCKVCKALQIPMSEFLKNME